MRKLKGIISVILLFAFVLSFTSVYAEETLVEKHSAFGLYASEDEMEKEDEYITRERFASVLSVFYGVERGNEENGGMGLFSDVSADHWAAGSITAVCNNYCMLGYSDGTFRPKEAVTFDQAVRSFVVLLGYGDYSQHIGGYLNQATRLGLLNGVSAKGTEKLSRNQFSILLSNALKCETLEFHSITSNGEATYVESGTLLEEKLGIYEINGVVKATDKMSIGLNAVLAENKVKIGDYVFNCYQPIDDYVGMNCRAYYRKDRDGVCTIVYIEKNEKNNVLEVRAEEIVPDRTTLTSFTYTKNNKKYETVKIAQTATMIFNGRNHVYFDIADLTPRSGRVKFIDSDSDKVYDTIIVKSFVDYFVDSVNISGGKLRITDYLGKPAIEIDLENEGTALTVYKKGELADYSQIVSDCIISVAESKGVVGVAEKTYEIIISDTVVVGAVKVYDQSGKKAVIENLEADFSAYYNYVKFPVQIGVKTNAYLNAEGKIVAFKNDTRGFEYGFITAVDGGEIFSNVISVRIFTEKSSFEIFTSAKSVNVDGIRVTNKDTLVTKLRNSASEYLTKTANSITPSTGFEQLVRFEKNAENEITMIDTVCANENDANSEIKFNEVTNITGTVDAPKYIFPSSRTIEGLYSFVNNAPTFYIPSDVTETKAYKMSKNFGSTNDQLDCKVCLFDMDDMNVFRAAVVNKGAATSVARKNTNSMALVDEICKVLTDDGDAVNEIVAYTILNGSRVSILADDELFNSVSINPGDIIRYSTGSDGLATVIEKTAAADGTGSTLTADTPYTKFYDDFRITMGRVLKKKDGFVKVFYGGSVSAENVHILDGVSCVLVFDADAKGTKTRRGTLSDIKSDEDNGAGDGNTIFTYQYYGLINALVIYE